MSAISSNGVLRLRRCACDSVVVVRSPSGPIMHISDVTTASRMGSIGGLVTWATHTHTTTPISMIVRCKDNRVQLHQSDSQVRVVCGNQSLCCRVDLRII